MGKIGCVAIVKNEERHIAEWLAWQLLVGFDMVLLLDNASTDRTKEVARGLSPRHDVRIIDWPGSGQGFQAAAYDAAARRLGEEFEWLAFFDADEFLVLDDGLDLKTLLAARPEAAIAIPWALFGSSGHKEIPPGLVIESYLHRAPPEFAPNRHVKSIIRPALMRKAVNPHAFEVDGYYVDLWGRFLSWAHPGYLLRAPEYHGAKIHHYFTRSWAHWQKRLARGNLGVTRTAQEFHAYDRNEVFDDSALYLAPRLTALLAGTSLASDLIFDIGMSEGNDTEFYLAKGFRVVGVEPDVKTYYALTERFAAEIEAGRLYIYNLAAGARYGEIAEFFHHEQHQGLSGLSNSRDEFQSGRYRSYHVMTIDWVALTEKHGVPYYVKIDIEGNELAFLNGAAGKFPLPTYVSVECHTFAPVQALYDLGYRLFKLIDQNPQGGFRLPEKQAEGRAISWPQFNHASGPFGRELPGEWVDFETFRLLWQQVQPEYVRTWFDCHAWMP